jgi:predicted MFS family arabinose efflux permease
MGTNSAAVAQYRFAAVESVSPKDAGKAISFVMIGGIFAGYLGPEVIKRTSEWLNFAPYTGSFVILAGFYLVVIFLMLFFQEPIAHEADIAGAERPLRQIVRQPTFVLALAASTVGYGAMTLIMTATPINMHVIHDFSLDATAYVIESHIIAMFLPSLFTGFLLQRLGVLRMILLGLANLFICVGIGLYSQAFIHYWWALVLLGVGWNFLFVGGTALLTQSYWPAERFKAQAANDFTVFGVQAVSSLSAGTLLAVTSWGVLNLVILPFLIMLMIGFIALRRYLSPVSQHQTALETSTTD